MRLPLTLPPLFDRPWRRSVRRAAALAAATVLPASGVLIGLASPDAFGGTVQSYPPGNVYSAAAYGAVCNGTLTPSIGAGSVDGAAIQEAINKAENDPNGATVLLPPGRCMIAKALDMSTGFPITLTGSLSVAGQVLTTVSDTVNPAEQAGVLEVLNDHNTVENMIINESAYGSTGYIRANYTTLKGMTLLGGPAFYAISFAGKGSVYSEGNQLLNSTVVSLVNRDVFGGSNNACDDGLEWGHQDQSLIDNVSFTGTRLALFQDTNTTVENYTYHPGPQTCGLDAWQITQPSANITLNGVTSYGSAGTIGNTSPFPGTSANVTIENESVFAPTPGAGYSLNGPSHGLIIRNANGVTVENSSLDSGTGANSEILFNPTVASDGVVIQNVIVPQVRFLGVAAAGSSVPGLVNNPQFIDDTFPSTLPGVSPAATFVNNFGGPATFTVQGSACTGQNPQTRKTNGFFLGANTTFNLIGTNCPMAG